MEGENEDFMSAAAAKSLQSCPTLCDPIDGSPPGSPIPGILQARTLEWVAISFSFMSLDGYNLLATCVPCLSLYTHTLLGKFKLRQIYKCDYLLCERIHHAIKCKKNMLML